MKSLSILSASGGGERPLECRRNTTWQMSRAGHDPKSEETNQVLVRYFWVEEQLCSNRLHGEQVINVNVMSIKKSTKI